MQRRAVPHLISPSSMVHVHVQRGGAGWGVGAACVRTRLCQALGRGVHWLPAALLVKKQCPLSSYHGRIIAWLQYRQHKACVRP